MQATPLFDALVFSKVRARLGGRVKLIVSGGAPLAGKSPARPLPHTGSNPPLPGCCPKSTKRCPQPLGTRPPAAQPVGCMAALGMWTSAGCRSGLVEGRQVHWSMTAGLRERLVSKQKHAHRDFPFQNPFVGLPDKPVCSTLTTVPGRGPETTPTQLCGLMRSVCCRTCGGVPEGDHVRAGGAGLRADRDLRRLLHQRPRPTCEAPLPCLLLHAPGRLPGTSCLPSDHCGRPCVLTSA